MFSFYYYLEFRTQFLFFFSIGIFLQSLFMLYMQTDLKNFVSVIGKSFLMSLIALIPGRKEKVYNPYMHYWGVVIVYTATYNLLTNKNLLPTINEYTVLILNILFLYYFFGYFSSEFVSWHSASWFLKIVTLALLIPSFFVLINAFVPCVLAKKAKVALYVWYLLISAALLGLFYAPTIFRIAVNGEYFNMSWLTMLTMGMVTFCFIIDVANVALLIPVTTDKRQSFAERLANIRAHIDLLCSKFADDQLNIANTLILLTLVLGLLGLNHYYWHFNAFIVVNLTVLGQRFFYRT